MRGVGVGGLLIVWIGVVHAQELTVAMNRIDKTGAKIPIGKIAIGQTTHGTLFEPSLTGLEPGLHGFHVHENPACGPGMDGGEMKAGYAAGGHWDPSDTGRHEGPYGEGHLGDLPALYVNNRGEATHPVLAPRITIDQLYGHALVVHEGGDNYADKPESLGGGGERIACGVMWRR